MRGKGWKALAVVGILAVLAFTGWTLPSVEDGLSAPKTGVMVDAASGKPIAHGHVIARWYHYHVDRFFIGSGHGGGGTYCLERREVETDAGGRFSIPSPHFGVDRMPSVRYDNRYFWEVNVYVPGYRGPEGLDVLYASAHPAAHGIGTLRLDPITMTPDMRSVQERAWAAAQLPMRLDCPYATGEPLDFTRTLFEEAYQLACEAGGTQAIRGVAEMRIKAGAMLPYLPDKISDAIQAILHRYYFTAPLSSDDAAAVCAMIRPPENVK